MKVSLVLFFCLSLLSQSSPSPALSAKDPYLEFDDVMEIIGGVFVGMGVDVKATEIAPCVLDTSTMGLLLQQALSDFLEKSYTGKVEAMAKLALAYKDLPSWMKTCVPASEEAAVTIEKMILAWGHPTSVLYHMGENLIVNGQDIFADVSYAMGAFETKQYFDFGFFCGLAAFKIIYVPDGTPEVTSSAVGGIMNGLAAVANLPQQDCLTESLAGGLFKEAFTQADDFGGTVDAMRLLSQAVSQVFAEAEECSGVAYTTAFVMELAMMVEPTSMVCHKRFKLLDGIDISELAIVKANYINRDWENVGHYIGKLLSALAFD